MQHDEQQAIKIREKHREVFNQVTGKHRGRILQYFGDGTLSIFNSAVDAVSCGIEMQLKFTTEPVVPVRIGIHSGDVLVTDEEIIGDSVNIASRIESLAIPGSIFISEKVVDEVKNQSTISTIFVDSFQLKNVAVPVNVFAVSNDGLEVPEAGSKTNIAKQEEKEKSSDPFHSNGTGIILATKLYIPQPRQNIVDRSRLIRKIENGITGKLTLISAPAGFGKTTITSQWISQSNKTTVWLSLDEGDNDPKRFLDYLIAALQGLDQSLGHGVQHLFQSPQPPPIEAALSSLINDITSVQNEFVLVLDDFHVIKTEEILGMLEYLLDHMPPTMHIVVTTREDPDISLPRLRVRGQVTELRPKDLRFTANEAANFFNEVMGLALSEEDVITLEKRTEGWTAGLQLAALSMQEKNDTSGFIKAFAGDDRYVIDYLVEEVLRGQSEAVRSFMLRTSILNRLSGPLCNAVTGQSNSRTTLESLERNNLFLISLDNNREWYRYHHLFAEVLQTHLKEMDDEEIKALHKRASKWYVDNDMLSDAIRHVLLISDFEYAADLIELAWPMMDRSFMPFTWISWARQLPEEMFKTRPVLCAAFAWAHLDIGEIEKGEAILMEVDPLLEGITKEGQKTLLDSSGLKVLDMDQFRGLPTSVATAHAYIAQSTGDYENTIRYARKALELVHDDDFAQREVAHVLLAMAQWSNGNLTSARTTFENFMEKMEKAGNIAWAIGPSSIVADIYIAQGRLNEALNTYEKSLNLVTGFGERDYRGSSELYLGIGEINWQQGNYEVAKQGFARSDELGRTSGLSDWQLRRCIAMSKIEEANSNFDAAHELLVEAASHYIRSPMPPWRPIQARIARIRIKQQKYDEVYKWADESNLPSAQEAGFLREFELITLARMDLAQFKNSGDLSLLMKIEKSLEYLLANSIEGKRISSVIEILILKAIKSLLTDNPQDALAHFEQALLYAQPEGYIHLFIDEGQDMEVLLQLAIDNGIMTGYAKRLLDAFENIPISYNPTQ
jgi:LuxR family maltose regulon positive regulatory protein